MGLARSAPALKNVSACADIHLAGLLKKVGRQKRARTTWVVPEGGSEPVSAGDSAGWRGPRASQIEIAGSAGAGGPAGAAACRGDVRLSRSPARRPGDGRHLGR